MSRRNRRSLASIWLCAFCAVGILLSGSVVTIAYAGSGGCTDPGNCAKQTGNCGYGSCEGGCTCQGAAGACGCS
jgi:hypothetical protein